MPSDLVCVQCGQNIADCPCADQDRRLRELAQSSGVAFKWCRKCDKHFARCKCEEFEFYLILNGKDVTEEMMGARNLLGQRVFIDLTKR